MALILDIETSGLPNRIGLSFGHNPFYKDVNKYNDCRIVQISYILCDKNFNLISNNTYIIKPTDFTIKNSQFHGITNEISYSQGKLFGIIAKKFYKILLQCSHIIAHNIDFDINVIKSELYRNNLTDIILEIDKKQLVCSMKETKNIVNIKRGNNIKDPSLKELYYYVFKKDIENQHNAKYDTYNLYKIINKLFLDKKCFYNLNIKFDFYERVKTLLKRKRLDYDGILSDINEYKDKIIR